MDNKNFKETRINMVTNDNYMESFRQNVRMFDVPLRELAEMSDIPYETLKSFLYGNAQDVKLSMAVKLANVFGCSIDELIGTNTIPRDAKASLSMLAVLPAQFTKFVRWVIRRTYAQKNLTPLDNCIAVVQADFVNNMLFTTQIEPIRVDAPADIIAKTFLAIRIPCDDFIPYYYKDDIVLIANDRLPRNNEHMLVAVENHFWIVKKDNQDHKTLIDDRINNNGNYIGYICYTERKHDN